MTNSRLLRAFRQYHRKLALLLVLPLLLTLITGILESLHNAWGLPVGFGHDLLMGLHTGSILRLGKIYPILNGLGLLALLVTGVSMMRRSPPRSDQPPSPMA